MKRMAILSALLALALFLSLFSCSVFGQSAFTAEEIASQIEIYVDNGLSALETDSTTLAESISDYDTYTESIGKIEAFYERVAAASKRIYLEACYLSADYAMSIVNEADGKDAQYDNLEDYYDLMYEDINDEIYSRVYEGIFDDLYDAFYDGALDDSDAASYSEWSKMRSSEYKQWSSARSEVYKQLSRTRSDAYKLFTRLRSDIYSGKVERGLKRIDDFREDTEKELRKVDPAWTAAQIGGNAQSEETAVPAESAAATEVTAAAGSDSTAESGGVTPEFQALMEGYEAFFDEYIAFMQEYKKDPTSLTLLSRYSSIMQEYIQVMDALDAIDESTLSVADAQYYTEVMLKISQKLLAIV